MQNGLRVRILGNLVSPYGLASISFLIFLFSWLFPPSIYRWVMGERDIVFLNAPTFLFYVLCVAGFTFGVWISYPQQVPFSTPKLSTRVPPVAFLLLPLLAGLLIAIMDMLQTLRESPDLLLLLAAQQATDLKGANAVVVQGHLASSAPPLAALSWWALWRFWQFSMTGWRAHVVRCAILFAILVIIGSSVLLISRNLIMESLVGIGLLLVLHRQAEGRLTLAFATRIGVIFIAGIVLLFGIFSFLRGTNSLEAQLYLLLGYSAASYNRLAAVVMGSLHYPFAGHGLYLSSFASFNDAFHRLIPLDRIFHWPNFFEEWTSEFGAVERAGLNGSLVFLGAFGFIFCDLGWLSPFWLLLYGLIYGIVWRAMRRSSTFGVVCYPFFGFCILFWFGTNLLLDSSLVPFLKYTVYLFVYEWLFLIRPPTIQADDGIHNSESPPRVHVTNGK
jgi:hypothetical protein